MRTVFFRPGIGFLGVIALSLMAHMVAAEPKHGIAMYGEPQLPPDFVSLPYVNPDAPKGGEIVFGEVGGFDSLNPHILKGRAPYGIRAFVFESLMGRSWDEPFTLYGLLAESIETGPNREWVRFTLREEARFSDGSPVTVEDVIWSFETLGTEGHPRYGNAWSKVASVEQSGPRSVTFTFNTEDRELALLLGLRPVLKKSVFDGFAFADSDGFDIVPIGSSPYVIDDVEPGKRFTLRRNPDYWGKDLPFNRGLHNLDAIRYEYFGDGDVVFEAFKGEVVTSFREGNPAKWDTAYNFPALTNGDIVKSLVPHQRPSGITGFVMNTRKSQFADWRVRDGLIHAFNYEFINNALSGGALPRITSYFSNSVLSMSETAAPEVAALLAPYADTLYPGALDSYALPVSDGSERNRANIRSALARFEEAGWTVEDGVMQNAEGAPFEFEILLRQGSSEVQAIADLYVSALERLGIAAKVESIDPAQYKERTDAYDFDMTYYRRGLSLSPGNEQMLYWGSDGVETPGTRNWMGMNAPAAEAMVETMLSATTREDFLAAVKALDRVLTTGRYVVPIWHYPVSRLAHSSKLKYPADRLPMYGDWIGFQPDIWWYED